jgi:hypothetical protein
MLRSGQQVTTSPWLLHFFQRLDGSVPAIDFFDSIPMVVVAEFEAILDAVTEAPPPAFAGGGKWEAMHGEMGGFYEARVQHKGLNYRLFCLLERASVGLGGSSLVVIEGLSKPRRTAASPKDYRRVLGLREEFREARRVLG